MHVKTKCKQLKKGIFLVIEGIDGAGKSTQVKLLKRWLEHLGHNVIATKEPTDESRYGKKIRSSMYGEGLLPDEELNLFIMDRKEHLKTLIIPALKEKKVVICDRYYYSNIAYQGAAGIEPVEIKRINEKFAVIPDAVFYLRIGVKEGLHRVMNLRKSKLTSFESENFLKRVSAVFDKMDYDYFHTIDAAKGEDNVSSRIIEIVKNIISEYEE